MRKNILNSEGTISVIVPVLNEAETVAETLLVLLDAPCPGVEIIVVDGDPAGSTIRTIRDRRVITATSSKGRARQMNRGAELASGHILVFLHADTVLPRRGLEQVRLALRRTAIVAGAFDLGIGSSRGIFRITETYVAMRTRLTRIPFGDQAIFIRKEYFEAMGGYRDIPLMEDVDLMKRIRRAGGRIEIISEKVTTSSRRWEREGVVFCTLRNWMLQLSYTLGIPPERLERWYKQ